MEAAHGSTDPQGLRDAIGKLHDGLSQQDAWDCVRHLFAPDADRHEVLEAIAQCHIASFDAGNEHLSSLKGQAHIDSCIRYLLGKLTAEARESMLKDFPVLMRAPEPTENASLQSAEFSPIVLTLSETGLRLPLDQRHAGEKSGDDGLRQHEADQLLARIQKEEPKQTETTPDLAHSPPALKSRATNTDDWLAERLRKFQPGFSARRDTAFSLNGEVEVDGDLVVCRHIARLWEEDFLRTAGKPTYQTLNSPAALQEAARPAVQSDVTLDPGVIGERIHRAQYWMSNDWGQVLTDNFDAMSRQASKDGAVCRTLYMVTPNHAMAVGLKIKDEAGARRYVVQFYDPNTTVAHQRSAITATLDQPGVPAEIRTLQPSDFLPEDFQRDYFLVDDENRSLPALFCGEKMEPGVSRFSGNLPDLDEHVMSFTLAYNLAEQLHAYVDQIRLDDDNTRLQNIISKDFVVASELYRALTLGHAEVITALSEVLKAGEIPLSPAQLMDLLSAKSACGTPGLRAALYYGKAEAVKAFGKLLRTCEPPLSAGEISELLSAREPEDGTPGLLAALDNASSDTIVAFGQVLETVAASLTPNQLARILAAESEHGRVALQRARGSGRVDAIAAYEDLLAKFVPDPATRHLKAQP
ncbi:ShET2/EspL2 family type III secretion system effector toxin [Bordetella sp. LUAb4]|uniref:ShET2/EspL2 family type III secretion system effector toxin n=1 Tax=Bordetella sp. LUAb4 TaxID=2843195 RepID=UPI001E3F4225|nr:ShET2/EspL2 family type III secretion system effector toxin [Bordetella sp. LUAb4]